MAIHWYSGILGTGTRKRSCVQTQWCAGETPATETPATETLAMRLSWGYPWLVRLDVLFFAFNIYTYVIFSFIEVGEASVFGLLLP
jgi:hypothetical protein